jgi:rhamnose transport system ATP-binding protein
MRGDGVAVPLLRLTGVRKEYGPVVALSDFSLDVRSGEIHALVGANGAGKSTLVKVISGAVRPDRGLIEVGGWNGEALSPREAQELGIATIYQEPDLVPTLTVAQNIALGREPAHAGFVRRHEEVRAARAICAQVGLPVRAVGMPVEALSRADQQLAEIAKALHRDARILLVDEPTAALGPNDAARLSALFRELTGDGVAIVYISHRLPEVLGIADRVTVIRDGRKVWTRPSSGLTTETLVQAMVGHELPSRAADQRARGETVLSIAAVTSGSRLADVSFEVQRGEVVGLAGLLGAGRSRLLRALVGLEPIDGGTVRLNGRAYKPRDPADALARGVGLLPEDRKRFGVFPELSIARNIALTRPVGVRVGLVSSRVERRTARVWIDRLRIQPPSPDMRVGALSGGNQQKVLLARWMHAAVDVFLVDEPGQGVDIAGRDEIIRIIREMAAAGKAVLVSSSETEELFALADRVLVMRSGRIAGELGAERSEQELIALAGGGGRAAASAVGDLDG